MRKHSAPEVQIKAAGGVRTLDDLLKVKALGVTRWCYGYAAMLESEETIWQRQWCDSICWEYD